MSDDLKLAIQAVKQAGKIIKEAYGGVVEVKRKGFNDSVTEIDVKAERIIVKLLKRTGYSIFGEESGKSDSGSRKKWIIDPIDGTSNFIRGIPFFAVSVALIENDRQLVLGVVYDPISDECYWAERNKDAYLNGKKIHASSKADFDGSVILIEHGRAEESKIACLSVMGKLMLDDGPLILRQGSTALMLCYVAKGSCEAFLSSGDELYDYAGGLIIAKEAGVIISDWKGKPWDNSSSYILAASPILQKKILKRL